MRTVTDAHRSLARYVSEILPDFDVWGLRTEPQEERPYAVVKPVQIPQLRAGSKQIIDVSQPFIVYIYPEIGVSALEGQARKIEIEELFYDAFFVTHSRRVPLYDYSGIPADEPGPEMQQVSAWLVDGVTPAGYDWLLVREYQISSAQDETDERRWSITLTLRLAWRRHGQLLSGVPVTSITTSGSVR